MELKFSLLAYFFFSNSVNKNYFTLNASADLSALWVIFAELLRNLQSCAIVLFVSKLPKHNNTTLQQVVCKYPFAWSALSS